MIQTILIFGLMCVGSYFYYVHTTKKAKAINDNFDKEAAKENLSNHITEIINVRTPYLKNWIKDRSIDSFTDASIAISLKDKAKGAAIDAAKAVAWRVVGVKAKYQRTDPIAHLILSNDELIYVAANMDGDLETHITFTKEQLINAKMEFSGPKKGADLASGISDFVSEKMNKEENLVNTYAITITHNNEPITIQAHDKIMLEYVNTEHSIISNLIADDFFLKLGEKYPNLKATKTKLIA